MLAVKQDEPAAHPPPEVHGPPTTSPSRPTLPPPPHPDAASTNAKPITGTERNRMKTSKGKERS